ncbi:MAG: TIGR00269 family protein [Candidatus Brockarchaeota archaeon]|nr:TIGR00269 family protein [Candidatus Brockarchaeota archaeon]
MIKPGDRVCVGLSGGKDSSALLLVLKKLAPKVGISRLVAATLDEGISGYREEAVRIAKSFAERLEVEHAVFSFGDLFGVELDDIASASKRNLCSACGVLRRRALDIAAREAGCNVVATGHTREDNAQTLLMNVIRGEPQRLARTAPKTDGVEGFIPRIKPFSYTSERDVALYAYLSGIAFQEKACPYRKDSLRLRVLTTLNKMENVRPNSHVALTRSIEKARDGLIARSPRYPLERCAICGYPSARMLCKVCQLAIELGFEAGRG